MNTIKTASQFPLSLKLDQLFTAADKWPSKWFKTYYRVISETEALPIGRAHYWNSTLGNVEKFKNAVPVSLTYDPTPRTIGDPSPCTFNHRLTLEKAFFLPAELEA